MIPSLSPLGQSQYAPITYRQPDAALPFSTSTTSPLLSVMTTSPRANQPMVCFQESSPACTCGTAASVAPSSFSRPVSPKRQQSNSYSINQQPNVYTTSCTCDQSCAPPVSPRKSQQAQSMLLQYQQEQGAQPIQMCTCNSWKANAPPLSPTKRPQSLCLSQYQQPDYSLSRPTLCNNEPIASMPQFQGAISTCLQDQCGGHYGSSPLCMIPVSVSPKAQGFQQHQNIACAQCQYHIPNATQTTLQYQQQQQYQQELVRNQQALVQYQQQHAAQCQQQMGQYQQERARNQQELVQYQQQHAAKCQQQMGQYQQERARNQQDLVQYEQAVQYQHQPVQYQHQPVQYQHQPVQYQHQPAQGPSYNTIASPAQGLGNGAFYQYAYYPQQ